VVFPIPYLRLRITSELPPDEISRRIEDRTRSPYSFRADDRDLRGQVTGREFKLEYGPWFYANAFGPLAVGAVQPRASGAALIGVLRPRIPAAAAMAFGALLVVGGLAWMLGGERGDSLVAATFGLSVTAIFLVMFWFDVRRLKRALLAAAGPGSRHERKEAAAEAEG